MSMSLYDPAARRSPEFSVRANHGDICVACVRDGYWVGTVTKIAADGMATQLDVGGTLIDVSNCRKGVEPLNNFGPDVDKAFGWCKCAEDAEERLLPHLLNHTKGTK